MELSLSLKLCQIQLGEGGSVSTLLLPSLARSRRIDLQWLDASLPQGLKPASFFLARGRHG
jgi:hypothetical protein